MSLGERTSGSTLISEIDGLKRTFERQVLRLRPDFGVVDGHFYIMPVGHILCGFVCDGPPSGKYIACYALPLYDRVDFIALTFSERLPYPHDLLHVGPGEEKSAAQEFVQRIGLYDSEVRSLQEFDKFCSFVERQGGLNNPWVRRGYALTQVMLGDRARAEVHFEILLKTPGLDRYHGFREDITQINRYLVSGNVAAAQRKLVLWEHDTKKRFGLA